MSNAKGPAAMPAPHSNKAPFFGDQTGDTIEVFLREFESLALTYALTPRERIEQILRYVSPELCDLWQFLDGYASKDWQTFRQSIQEIYGGTSVMSRYSKQRLREFIKLTSKSRMVDEDDVRTYYKRFLVLCRSLIQNCKITDEECNAAFWGGFHPEDWRLMYPRLLSSFPHHPKAEPFDFEDVFKVARAEFTNGHFTAFTLEDDWDPSFIEEPAKPDPMFQKWFNLGAQDSGPSDSDRRGRDRGRNSTISEFRHREDTPRREAYHTSQSTNRSVRFQENSRERENREIDDIITQLQTLSPSDSTYASLYACCLHRYPAIAQTMQKPDYGYRSAFSLNSPPSITPNAPPSFLPSTPPSFTSRQSWSECPAPPSRPSDASAAKASFFRRDGPDGCAFCQNPGHRVRRCPIAEEYFDAGRISIINERIYLLNGQPVPNDGSNRGLRHSVDAWLARQPPSNTSLSFTRNPPPHKTFAIQTCENYLPPVAKAHIVEIADAKSENSGSDDEEDRLDIFGVFATEKKKKQAKADKLPELATPRKTRSTGTSLSASETTPIASLAPTLATPSASALKSPPSSSSSSTVLPSLPHPSTSGPTLSPSRPAPQYRYQATVEDQQLTIELTSWLINGKLSLTTPAHILAASLVIHKELCEKLRPQRVETSWIEEVPDFTVENPMSVMEVAARWVAAYSLPLHEIDVLVNRVTLKAGVLDQGSQIVLIRQDLAQEANVSINTAHQIDMEGANGTVSQTLGCAENLVMQVGDVAFEIHAHVVEHAPFCLLLGRPFHHLLLCRLEDHPDGTVDLSVCDPADPARAVNIPSRARQAQVGFIQSLACTAQASPPCTDSLCL